MPGASPRLNNETAPTAEAKRPSEASRKARRRFIGRAVALHPNKSSRAAQHFRKSSRHIKHPSACDLGTHKSAEPWQVHLFIPNIHGALQGDFTSVCSVDEWPSSSSPKRCADLRQYSALPSGITPDRGVTLASNRGSTVVKVWQPTEGEY